MEPGFLEVNLRSVLPPPRRHLTPDPSPRLHHRCVSTPCNRPHVRRGTAALPQLCPDCVDMEGPPPKVLCGIHQILEPPDVPHRCLCNLPAPLLHQVSECFVHPPVPGTHSRHGRVENTLTDIPVLRWHHRIPGQRAFTLCSTGCCEFSYVYFSAGSTAMSLSLSLLPALFEPLQYQFPGAPHLHGHFSGVV